MQRARIETVTDQVPILIPCNPEHQEGLATFNMEFATPEPVRIVTDTEINERVLKGALAEMWDYEREEFQAVGAFVIAMRGRDRLAITSARNHVAKAALMKREDEKKRGTTPIKEDDLEFGRHLIRLFGLEPGQEKLALERWNGYRRGPIAEARDEWLLSQLMSKALESVRLVLWWSRKQFRPAIYCPKFKDAVYAFLLMRVGRGRGWGVCPRCGEFFLKQKRSDQSYCSIAHREAHRVARWRAGKRSRKRKKRGGPHGTDQAR